MLVEGFEYRNLDQVKDTFFQKNHFMGFLTVEGKKTNVFRNMFVNFLIEKQKNTK
jgi:hypothetical protein